MLSASSSRWPPPYSTPTWAEISQARAATRFFEERLEAHVAADRCLLVFFWEVRRIGEASDPGPGLDDPDADAFDDLDLYLSEAMASSLDELPMDFLHDSDLSAPVQADVPFAVARKFSGRRPGTVCKMGEHGFG